MSQFQRYYIYFASILKTQLTKTLNTFVQILGAIEGFSQSLLHTKRCPYIIKAFRERDFNVNMAWARKHTREEYTNNTNVVV